MIHLAFAMCRGAGCVDTVLAASRYKKYNFWSPGTVRCLTEPLDHGNVEGGARVRGGTDKTDGPTIGMQKSPAQCIAKFNGQVRLNHMDLLRHANLKPDGPRKNGR